MECCAALVVACVACDQRFAFSENTTGTIWCAFQRELADWLRESKTFAHNNIRLTFRTFETAVHVAIISNSTVVTIMKEAYYTLHTSAILPLYGVPVLLNCTSGAE